MTAPDAAPPPAPVDDAERRPYSEQARKDAARAIQAKLEAGQRDLDYLAALPAAVENRIGREEIAAWAARIADRQARARFAQPRKPARRWR